MFTLSVFQYTAMLLQKEIKSNKFDSNVHWLMSHMCVFIINVKNWEWEPSIAGLELWRLGNLKLSRRADIRQCQEYTEHSKEKNANGCLAWLDYLSNSWWILRAHLSGHKPHWSPFRSLDVVTIFTWLDFKDSADCVLLTAVAISPRSPGPWLSADCRCHEHWFSLDWPNPARAAFIR